METFHDAHFRRYAVKEEGGTIECINWKGRITAFLDKPSFPTEAVADTALPAPRRTMRAYFGESGALDTPLHLGDDLHPGMVVAGSAIIEEPTTTIVVYPGSSATVTPGRNYLLETAAAGA